MFGAGRLAYEHGRVSTFSRNCLHCCLFWGWGGLGQAGRPNSGGLVLGCIEVDFCRLRFVSQHFSSSIGNAAAQCRRYTESCTEVPDMPVRVLAIAQEELRVQRHSPDGHGQAQGDDGGE